MVASDPVDTVGFCGLFCGACRIRQGKVKETVDALRQTTVELSLDKLAPRLAQWEPSFKHYDGFKQVMDGIVKMFGQCAGCPSGGGDPGCEVRICAKQKGYRTCAECKETKTCPKLDAYRTFFEPALQEIKQKGIKRYAQEMHKKTQQGYSYPAQLNSPP